MKDYNYADPPSDTTQCRSGKYREEIDRITGAPCRHSICTGPGGCKITYNNTHKIQENIKNIVRRK